MHVMMRLNTLGARPDAVILQVGAVLFEPRSGGRLLNGKGFNEYVLLQDGSGSIDHGSLCRWLTDKAGPRMGEALMTRALPLTDVLVSLGGWPRRAHDLEWRSVGGVWTTAADHATIRSAFSRYGMDTPWGRGADRCHDTLFDLFGGIPTIDGTGFVEGDALDEAVMLASAVQEARRVHDG
ncbi:MAG: 3'-5' exoribonuclease [Thermoplasmata archaeon]